MQSVTPFSSLRDEQELMTTLLALMKEEQLHLVAADIDAVAEITVRKTALIGQLSQLAAQRHQALAAAGFMAAEAGMEDWLVGAGIADAAPLWKALLETTREAKEQNRLNSLLVNKHMLHTQGALNALRPTAQSGNFYGPSGQPTTNTPNRRVVIG
ncbi:MULTISPECIES: flagella synthesis protein FlgN [unclassified Janthinobacterium]|uniref:flagella synthesis protein FlgN n=1 Tax=unclassified Janthinobacterium TaxID=2610881 RepID=UPI0008F5382A|nr:MULTISPECIES: flagellar protein FlgN [unclassified Janthinobacterium]APA67227.1 flagellar biosynthesis protein FlgN [Janthinobacterium sp. 1_2014MBL_MicDiv]MDN2708691.1 flagellar protein FlgN [Janthinobacterium sp. SUN118]